MQPEELAEAFLLFKGLGREQLGYLAPLFSQAAFREGETIFARGAPAETVYVLEDGQVALRFQPEDGESLTIATINRGYVFGWSAVLGRPYYTSSAVCVVKSRALAMDGEELRALIRAQPELSIILGRMALTVAGRQANAQFQITHLINKEISRAAA
jgi:CRP/FNR family transcriptional regulator